MRYGLEPNFLYKPNPRSKLSSVIKSIQYLMRQDSGIDGDAQRSSLLTRLLLLKVLDGLEEASQLARDHCASPIPESMRWRNWAADAKVMTGDMLLREELQDILPNHCLALDGIALRAINIISIT